MALPTSPPTNATRAARGVVPRRAVVGGILASLGLSPIATPALPRALPDATRAWGVFKERFVTGGRVVDTGNGGISHSEGQGIALMTAAQTGDRESFDRIHAWTRENLARPFDALHAWRYRPNAAIPVDDLNNATDGDLLITAALFSAAVRWDSPSYYAAAMAITHEIRRSLVKETGRGVVLLPGLHGFAHQGEITVNPSYYVFPALRRMSLEMPDPIWDRLAANGVAMLRAARFGRWNLPPDWLTISSAGDLKLSEHAQARFSFDAVRVPLYMCWAGLERDPVVDSVHSFWSAQDQKYVPAWADLRTGEMAPYTQSAGMIAIRRYVAAARSGRDRKPDVPSVSDASDYYAAALILLVQNAMTVTPGIA